MNDGVNSLAWPKPAGDTILPFTALTTDKDTGAGISREERFSIHLG